MQNAPPTLETYVGTGGRAYIYMPYTYISPLNALTFRGGLGRDPYLLKYSSSWAARAASCSGLSLP